MDLEETMLSEISQTQRTNPRPFVCEASKTVKRIAVDNRMRVTGNRGTGPWGAERQQWVTRDE